MIFFLSEEDKNLEISPESDTSSEESVECRNVEVKLTVKINELQSKNHQLEESECSFRSEMERLQLKAQEKDEEVRRMAAERDSMERELQDVLTQKQVIIVTGRESVTKKWEDRSLETSILKWIFKMYMGLCASFMTCGVNIKWDKIIFQCQNKDEDFFFIRNFDYI